MNYYEPLVVIHETILSLADTCSTLQSTPEAGTYHALIGTDGAVIYGVDPSAVANAAANSSFEDEAVDNSVDDFAYHIALETPIDGRNADDTNHSGYTEEQYMSLAWLTSRTNVPLSRITTHEYVDNAKTSKDPRSFDSDLFERLFNNFPSTAAIDLRMNPAYLIKRASYHDSII